jgi:adenylate cyclase
MAGPATDTTFLFADIAGYTALTEAHGDEQAADVAGAFCSAVADLIPAGQGEIVKTIGDAVMVRAEEAAVAVRLGLDVAHDLMAEHGSPAVRVGVHCGPAVERNGDWFGSAVNIAARVAALAGGGEVLVTDAVRRAAGHVEEVRYEPRGEHSLRNLSEAVPVFAVRGGRAGVDEHQLDPVCRMMVEPGREAGKLTHDGVDYCFCSLECAGQFAARPKAYVRN